MVRQMLRRIGTWSARTQVVMVAAGAAHMGTALPAWTGAGMGASVAHDATGLALVIGVGWVAWREGARKRASREAYLRWVRWCACVAPLVVLWTFVLTRGTGAPPAPTPEQIPWLIGAGVLFLAGTAGLMTSAMALTALAYAGRRLVRGDTAGEATRASQALAQDAQWRKGARRAGACVWAASLLLALCVATLPEPWHHAAAGVMRWALALGIAAMLDVLSRNTPARERAKAEAKPAPAPTFA